MGYRKRGPKPKPLVVQVNAWGSPAPQHGSIPSPGSWLQWVSSCSGARRVPRGPRAPSAELIRQPQPCCGWAALAGCSAATSCSAPVPRQLIEGCFSSFHCFINLEQCTASKLE